MKACKLKIISSNIIGDIDTPKIQYISKNTKMKFDPLLDEIKDNNVEKINCLEEKIKTKEEILTNKDEEKIVKNIQIEELIKYNLINNTNTDTNTNLNIIKEEENLISEENNKKIMEEDKNNLIIEEINKKKENNVDINDLCTISNNFLYKEDCNNLSINNNINDLNVKIKSSLNNNN